MTMNPWGQRAYQGVGYGEEEPWWSKLLSENAIWRPDTGWQPQKWLQAGLEGLNEPQPAWLQAAMMGTMGAGGIGSLGAGGLGQVGQMAGQLGQDLLGGLGKAGSWGTQALTNMPLKGVPWWIKAGVPVGYLGYQNRPTGWLGQAGPEEQKVGAATEINPEGGVGTEPYGPVEPIVAPKLPQPGQAVAYTGEPFGQPQIVESGGQKFWWNPMGNGGIGGWGLINPREFLTPEQQIQQAQLDREAAMARAQAGQYGTLSPEQQIAQKEADRLARIQEAVLQTGTQQDIAKQQILGAQEQARLQAALDQQQMYQADPYKYWAQMGTPTPEAVARLTGGQVQAGQPFQPGTALSTPSAQWWGNLLPSEQQQVMGGVNWLGVNPADWYSMYQRMIPGLGQRQVEPRWAR